METLECAAGGVRGRQDGRGMGIPRPARMCSIIIYPSTDGRLEERGPSDDLVVPPIYLRTYVRSSTGCGWCIYFFACFSRGAKNDLGCQFYYLRVFAIFPEQQQQRPSGVKM